MILAAIYFFPFGQDIVVMWLTNVMGSQFNAWMALYAICFALFAVGFWLGGGRKLGLKLVGVFRMARTNPILFIIILAVAFFIFWNVGGQLAGG